MKPKTVFNACLGLLTLLNIHHAFAGDSLAAPTDRHAVTDGNGADRGGGDTVATLEGLLPKRIQQRLTIDYRRDDIREENLPQYGRHRCGAVFTCHEQAEQVVTDLEMKLVAQPAPHYETVALQAHYLFKGEWKRVPVAGLKRTYPLSPYLTPDEDPKHSMTVFGTYSGSARFVVAARIWFDGVEFLSLSNLVTTPSVAQATMIRKFWSAQTIIAHQTDFNNLDQARKAIPQLNAFQPLADSLHYSLFGLESGLSFHDASRFFLERMQSDQSRLVALAKSAIAPDGKCDARAYAQLVAQLKAWKTGSPAYFYELNGGHLGSVNGGVFSTATQLSAMGIRQQVREELNRTVVPYCEPQHGGRGSQVDLSFND